VLSVQGSRQTGFTTKRAQGATVCRSTCAKSAPKSRALSRASLWLDKGFGEYLKAVRGGMVDLSAGADRLKELFSCHAEEVSASLVEESEQLLAWDFDYVHVDSMKIDDGHDLLTVVGSVMDFLSVRTIVRTESTTHLGRRPGRCGT
jgi:hypothetical protein